MVDPSPEALSRASALYQGELLAGLAIGEASFDEWLFGERERLRELALEGLDGLLAHQRKVGALEAATRTALHLLAIDPLQETVHRTLMQLHADRGRRGSALRQYQLCVSALQRELGVEPEPETKQLYQEILTRRPAGRAAGLPSVPPVSRTSGGAPTGPLLPGAMATETPMIGREVELAALGEALASAGSGRGRVVAILGASRRLLPAPHLREPPARCWSSTTRRRCVT